MTRVFSRIKFWEDMAVLLAFMFLLNMLGALILIPALSHLLLRDTQVVASKAAIGSALISQN